MVSVCLQDGKYIIRDKNGMVHDLSSLFPSSSASSFMTHHHHHHVHHHHHHMNAGGGSPMNSLLSQFTWNQMNVPDAPQSTDKNRTEKERDPQNKKKEPKRPVRRRGRK
eukprot:TRINITY_DN7004_c0_g1_i1.p1 TRINITY_DN7004_c0_g1~~TRINITY_DN7004_c0_g1_i1.p1  ORF type:complete len:125 (+),score=30.50 TRINITY_DN7004_c0_g1_i1:50-376(+)